MTKTGLLYNIASTPKFIFSDKPINNRAKLDTGTQCNYRCDFCYYFDKLDQVTPFETIKNRIDYLIDCGISEVDLSGGESSYHPDWFKILDYCNKHPVIANSSYNEVEQILGQVNHYLDCLEINYNNVMELKKRQKKRLSLKRVFS